MARKKVTDATPESENTEPEGGSAKLEDQDTEPADREGKPQAKPPAAKTGSAKSAPARASTAKRTPARASTAKRTPARASTAKPGTAKLSATEAGSAKLSATEAGSAKLSAAEAGSAKTGVSETGEAKGKGATRGKSSGTAAAAAQARAIMQRRHLRIGFAMTAAIGAEIAGAVGLIAGGLLPWEWGERLAGRSDQAAVVIQVAIVLTVIALALAWLPARSERANRWRIRSRAASLLPAAVVAGGAVAMIWQAERGARDAGGVVTVVAAGLVLLGSIGWLIGLRQLRVLFPFGLADARGSGYGNVRAVRRAQQIGGPVGAVGGIVVVAGALLVVPVWVATEDSQTASALALTGETPGAGAEPAWEIELPAAPEGTETRVWSTAAGLVIEEVHGARGVDPRTGELRWHWRDEAYRRVAGSVTDQGGTVVLALEYDGDLEGRDRVVGLDAATGELRWDRFDDDLVAAMGTVVISPEEAEGDWFVVPEQEAPDPTVDPAAAQDPPVNLLMVGSDDGELRWRATQDDGCRFAAVNADAPGVVVTSQQCFNEESATQGCLVTGLDPATGDARWTWPPDGTSDSVSDCQTTPTAELLFVGYQAAGADGGDEEAEEPQPSQAATVALDPATGEQAWAAEPADDGTIAGLANPMVVGDAVLGTQTTDDGSGTGGSSVLVIRDAADGSVREEVALPAGQPLGIVPVRDGFAVISSYLPESSELVLVEIDLAQAAVSAETPVVTAPADSAIRQVSVTAGPEALVVDTLIAAGAEPGPEDYTLHVYGW